MSTPLEKLQADSQVKGLLGKEAVRIVSAQMMGEACQVFFRDSNGKLHDQIIFRDQESQPQHCNPSFYSLFLFSQCFSLKI